jgi:hypothetical protein
VVLNPHNSYSGNEGRRIMNARPTWAKVVRPYFKNKIGKIPSWGMAEVVA